MKTEHLCIPATVSGEWKNNPPKWREIFQNYISDKGLSHIIKKISKYNKQITLLKNGQRVWRDIYPKKIYKRPISTWKYAQHYLSKKCKSNSQWDTTA